ncbi:hypothetical protein [Syntrophomonas palmitatica]|uniref:hypothetical protein n=1 Tax=Syntrophomonas palmitatica TaxID=402877 RepID=UPI001A9A5D35
MAIDTEGDLPRVKIEVSCSKGTYVRTLCHDIGQALGTGAFLSELRRTHSGAFKIEDAYPLDELKPGRENIARALQPLDYPLGHLPELVLQNDDQVNTILHGGSLFLAAGIAGRRNENIYAEESIDCHRQHLLRCRKANFTTR